MFRTTTARSLPRSLSKISTASVRPSRPILTSRATLNTLARAARPSKSLSLALRKPIATSLIRCQTTFTRDTKREEALLKETLPVDAALVSTGSSVHPVTSEVGVPPEEHDVDMMAGIRGDFVSQILAQF
jgi:hypothetical protein